MVQSLHGLGKFHRARWLQLASRPTSPQRPEPSRTFTAGGSEGPGENHLGTAAVPLSCLKAKAWSAVAGGAGRGKGRGALNWAGLPWLHWHLRHVQLAAISPDSHKEGLLQSWLVLQSLPFPGTVEGGGNLCGGWGQEDNTIRGAMTLLGGWRWASLVLTALQRRVFFWGGGKALTLLPCMPPPISSCTGEKAVPSLGREPWSAALKERRLCGDLFSEGAAFAGRMFPMAVPSPPSPPPPRLCALHSGRIGCREDVSIPRASFCLKASNDEA